MQIGVPNGGGTVRAEQQMQYAYGDQTVAPIHNLHDQPLQFATRESSDYASHHNAWMPHTSTGVVYPPIPSSAPSMPEVLLTLLVLSFIFVLASLMYAFLGSIIHLWLYLLLRVITCLHMEGIPH